MPNTIFQDCEETQICNGSILIEGMRFPAHLYAPKTIHSALAYNARADDIFIVTMPRSGTTWMQTIVYALLNNGQGFDENLDDFIARNPFLEMHGSNVVEAMPRPGAIKTHLVFEHIPYHPNAKYICVVRNPKDVCVSFYRFIVSLSPEAAKNLSFDCLFEQFLAGQTGHADYFDYLFSCWEHRDDPNVLFVLYEDMKANIRSSIIRVAQFLNIDLNKKLLERTGLVTQFDYLKQNRFNERIIDSEPSTTIEFVRKGIVGDWRTVLSDEQSRRLDAHFYEKTRDIPGLNTLWHGYNVFNSCT